MNTLIEEDWESMFVDESPDMIEQRALPQRPAEAPPPTVFPLAPLADGQLPASSTPAPLLRRNVGPLPVWGWALVATAAGVGGWYYLRGRGKDPEKNGADESEREGESGESSESGWSPSRSRFADMLRRFFSKSGVADKVTVYHDADDAKKAKLKHVSPLVTIVAKGQLPMKELEKFSRREGLKPIAHEGGIIGFYPVTGKRGRAWEEYIDLLRDDGQTV